MRVTSGVMRLSAYLRAADSATRALDAWCVEHGIGAGPILADKQGLARPAPPDADLLDALAPVPGETVEHRRVTLRRGDVALSDCDLWWLPDRLAPGLAAELDATSIPFGAAIAGLRPTRRTIFAAALPDGLPHILELRALVLAGATPPRPIAAARERYRRALLARG
jgi:hypothetical protein